ncbi:gluconate:H+ symporter [Carnimonas nigrificans]|uniref:gluconate:H+ symporter n=1 Tax=Carnimonas nigrificans TaxID=64323 RepID=UPI000470FA60|nr:gluconate:H+ symporter [Carnimonas nigrificans]
MPLIITALGILVLLVLIMKLRVQTLIALAIVSCLLAFALGMPLDAIVPAIEKGFGATLGGVGLIFVFGAILGKLLADAGGAQQISATLIERFGESRVQLSVMITAFVLGIALFFEVGLVLLIPIVYQIHRQTQKPLLYLALPMITALSVTHAFLPPHPGPTVIASEYQASIGMVLIYGVIVAIPTLLLAGPLFVWLIKRTAPQLLVIKSVGDVTSLGEVKELDRAQLPGFGISAITAALPVLLMLMATIIKFMQEAWNIENNLLFNAIEMIGKPTMVMLISVLFAIFSMGVMRQRSMKELTASMETAVRSIAMLVMILGISGSFKEVLLQGGVGDYVKALFEHSAISPLLLAWLISAMIRTAQGSATVAALSTSAMVLPLMESSQVDPALMVLATGAGSVFLSHVNDTGFWLIKESFGLSIKQTFATWSVLETLISVFGLVFVLLLSLVV